MKPSLLSLFTAVLATVLLASCEKKVTNNVAQDGYAAPQEEGSGGVINGGGGRGVRCTKDGVEKVEVLDLYEARVIHSLETMNFGDDENAAKDKLAALLAKHFWTPGHVPMPKFTKYLRESMVDQFWSQIRFTEGGRTLKLSNDAFAPTLEEGCVPVQVAFYYDESVLLVDKVLWEKLDLTNKMGLIAHEALYFLARQEGTTNSMGTRKLVGMLFSPNGVKSLTDGVPLSDEKVLECRMKANGFQKGHFYLFNGKSEYSNNALEAVFMGIGSGDSLFRTSTTIEDLSFTHLQIPSFSGTRESVLIRDTYPPRDGIRFKFKGILDGELRAEMTFSKNGSELAAETYEVNCRLPVDFTKLEVQVTTSARYEQVQGDGSKKLITIGANGSFINEDVRQVGGTGGITDYGVVPYPTVCRVKENAIISEQEGSSVSYQVVSVELGDLTGLKDSAHCGEYVKAFNRKAADGGMEFTIDLKDFKKVE